MAKVVKLEDEISRLLREVSASECISWGTTAPYSFGPVGWIRRGFADRLLIKFNAFARERDIDAIVPLARQRILRAMVKAGVSTHIVSLRVHIKVERERLFTDENPSSPTCGKRKRGRALEFGLEVPNYKDRYTVEKSGLRQIWSPSGN